ncbi:MAG: bifunctional homocysteine S-methyltransferase/methylenetetrahydrofolate reductase [Dehalococcoidia bacterium]|nr:bifunctional homocysteine S-methyltransferase/methylenetetrahydrofolate reductase [Dehalococcoidia bacterium]
MRHPFLDALERGVVLLDGATGTELRARGWRGPSDVAVLERPDLVRRLHEDYIAAGSDLILTNTFAANRSQLARHGLGERVRDANFHAARIARDAREIHGSPVFIGGSVGPIGLDLALGAWTLADAHEAFLEQIGALIEGGVDVLVLETFPSLAEAGAALRAARALTDLPVVAMLNFNADLASPAGEPPEQIAATLAAAGADVVGINCGVGPQAVLDMLQRMAGGATSVRLAVKPNAGLPRVVGGRVVYPSTPAYCADFALRAKDLGASCIGGCCGTTPAHVRAMRDALGSGRATAAVTLSAPHDEPQPLDEPLARPQPSRLRDKLAAGRYVISVEIDPPRGTNPRKAIEGAAMLQRAGAEAINIGDSPMARVRMSALALAVLIQQQVGIETIIHQTTRDRNLMALQADMLGAHALGIRNVIALSGDPQPEASQSSAVRDVDSTGFIRVLKRLNEGLDIAGNSIGRPTDFFVACAANPTADDVALELRRVRAKLDAGADMLMTQPVYDTRSLRQFFERLGAVDVPVLLGVMPLLSARNAEFVHHELAGVTVPDAVRERMRAAGEAGLAVGLEIALEQIEETRALEYVSGIYLMPVFGRYEVAAEIVRRLTGRDA